MEREYSDMAMLFTEHNLTQVMQIAQSDTL